MPSSEPVIVDDTLAGHIVRSPVGERLVRGQDAEGNVLALPSVYGLAVKRAKLERLDPEGWPEVKWLLRRAAQRRAG